MDSWYDYTQLCSTCLFQCCGSSMHPLRRDRCYLCSVSRDSLSVNRGYVLQCVREAIRQCRMRLSVSAYLWESMVYECAQSHRQLHSGFSPKPLRSRTGPTGALSPSCAHREILLLSFAFGVCKKWPIPGAECFRIILKFPEA